MEPRDLLYTWNTANNNVTEFLPFTTNGIQIHADTLEKPVLHVWKNSAKLLRRPRFCHKPCYLWNSMQWLGHYRIPTPIIFSLEKPRIQSSFIYKEAKTAQKKHTQSYVSFNGIFYKQKHMPTVFLFTNICQT